MDVNEQHVERIVAEVVRNLASEGLVPATRKAEPAKAAAPPALVSARLASEDGVFETADEAVMAADTVQHEWVALGLEKRAEIIAAMRRAGADSAERMAKMALEETGMGRYEHKVLKNRFNALNTPGVEDLDRRVLVGDNGTTIVDRAPFGVICAITPSTNPTSTVINNGIMMLAGGNTVVFAPHPAARQCTARQMQILNRAIVEGGGPANLMTCVAEPGLRSAAEIMKHPKVDLICATGGGAVVRASLESGRKTIAAGPGNPPVIVDETVDLKRAARDVVEGALFDNNIVCVAEKQIILLEEIADAFKRQLIAYGCVELAPTDAARLRGEVFVDGRVNRELIGRDAAVLARAAGVRAPDDTKLLVFETQENDPFVQHEQLMPAIPILRVRTFTEAVALAVRCEHSFRHTAVIHSSSIERITQFGRAIGCTLFVTNAPSYAWSGIEGEGICTMTVAGPTGEGLTSARTFTRMKYSIVAGNLNVAR